jgi:molybdopterin synthase sulfur carrier subunit
MKVIIPSQLRSYSRAAEVQAEGSTLGELLADLERQFPGMRFRMIDEQDCIRRHIRIFVNMEIAEGLDYSLHPDDAVRIIGALSGG